MSLHLICKSTGVVSISIALAISASLYSQEPADPFGGGKKASQKIRDKKPDIEDPFGGLPSPKRTKIDQSKKQQNPFTKSDPFEKKEVGSSDPFGGSSPSKKKVTRTFSKTTSKTKPFAKTDMEIDRLLSQPANFEFVDTPLRAVGEQLAEDFRIRIYLDRSALEDAGFDVDEPITGKGDARSLRSALHFLLDKFDFTFAVKNETLIITTREAIGSSPEKYNVVRIYDATDLATDPEELLEILESTIGPESWSKAGGIGTGNVLKTKNKTLLIISQPSELQHKIEKFLEELNMIRG